jgi:DHA2 family multidrug resistance protein-like MFS transporter
MGLTMAPATESIMGSLPRAKAGIGSAMNDTTRQVGGAFGVAIIGSIMSSLYGSHVVDAFTQAGVTGQPAEIAKEGLGQALAVAGDPSVPSSVASELISGAKEAFVYGLHRGVLVGAAAAFLGAFIAFRWLPAREDPNSELQNHAPVAKADVVLESETVG